MSERDLERARLAELAVEDLFDALDAREAEEYRALRALHPDFDLASLERAAASLHLVAGVPAESMPERLIARLEGGADQYFGSRAAGTTADPSSEIPPRIPAAARYREMGGWLAAVACVLVAAALWPRPSVGPGGPAPPHATVAASVPAPARPAAVEISAPVAATAPVGVPVAVMGANGPVAPSPATERGQFLAAHHPVWQRAWRAGTDPAGQTVSGDVIWDPRMQEGFMRFHGLRRNDPNVEQYQLWIFDARRDERYPVDGGVFDVRNDNAGDVVRFKSRLPVEVPLMFVVTIERRGGVVVSDRTRIAALASSG